MTILIPDETSYSPIQPQIQAKNEVRLPSSYKKFFPVTVIFVFLMVIIGSIVFLISEKPEILGLKSPQTDTENTQRYIAEAQKLMLLPDETPIVRIITDLSALDMRDFFKNAKKDDVVLIYQISKKAVLYRPSEKKIIEIGTLNNEQKASSANNIPNISSTPPITPTSPTPLVTLNSLPSPTPTLIIISPTP